MDSPDWDESLFTPAEGRDKLILGRRIISRKSAVNDGTRRTQAEATTHVDVIFHVLIHVNRQSILSREQDSNHIATQQVCYVLHVGVTPHHIKWFMISGPSLCSYRVLHYCAHVEVDRLPKDQLFQKRFQPDSHGIHLPWLIHVGTTEE